MLKTKKCQMVGSDLMISILVLLLAVGLVYYFIINPDRSEKQILEMEEKFFLPNFKHNLQESPNNNFLQGYKVDEPKLSAFASMPDDSLKKFVLDGLGVNNESYDLCLFFEDAQGIIPVDGKRMIGEVYTDFGFTAKGPCNSITYDPCEYYPKVINFVMPVLKSKKIINMHVVACKQL